MSFSTIYEALKNKLERKGKTEEDLIKVFEWFAGYEGKEIKKVIEKRDYL